MHCLISAYEKHRIDAACGYSEKQPAPLQRTDCYISDVVLYSRYPLFDHGSFAIKKPVNSKALTGFLV
jgi:hypothetical protein